jgi:hypothetical protein
LDTAAPPLDQSLITDCHLQTKPPTPKQQQPLLNIKQVLFQNLVLSIEACGSRKMKKLTVSKKKFVDLRNKDDDFIDDKRKIKMVDLF